MKGFIMNDKEIKNDNVESNNTNNIPEPKNSNMNADFSQIFNVESEEKPKEQMELPKTQESMDESQLPKLDSETDNQEAPKKDPTVPKKRSTFNGEEKVLFEFKEEKESSIVVPIIVFIILIFFIVILPFISTKIDFDTYLGGGNSSETDDGEEPDFYFFNKSTVRAKIDDLEFTNFVKSFKDNEYRVSFTITNVGEKTFQFNKKYYLVMYNEEDRIVQRALIHSFVSIGAMDAQGIDLIITKNAYDKSVKFKIEEIPPSSYPDVKLLETEGEYEVLECVYGYDEMRYYFLDRKLAKIKEVYTERSDSGTFQVNKAIYKSTSARYKQVEGLSSTFVESSTYFTLKNEFELKEIPDATISLLKTYRFFKYNEKPEVISFELEAQGYSCS